MQSYPEPEVSLHRLLQLSAIAPDYIQVKPKGFKAILQSTLEFLEAQGIEGHLLVKLPVGEAWNSDIQRYAQGLAAPHRVVRFVRPEPVSPNPASPSPGPGAAPPPAEVLVPLGDGYAWRGDYFVVVQAENFVAMVVAHRLQPLSASLDRPRPGPEEPRPPVDDDDDLPPALAEATPPGDRQRAIAPRSSYLSVCCSIDPALVATVVQALGATLGQALAAGELPPAVATALHGPAALGPGAAISLPLVDRWLNWQLKQQEHLRQSASIYRRQALGMSSLTSQNEALLHTLRLKDDFLNTVGQELRTPLTTIKTALTLLDSPHLKPSQRQRYMEMISHECDRQSALISSVLNLLQVETSLGQTQPTPLSLGEAVPPIVSIYQPLAEEKGIMLAYTISAQLPAVSCPDSWLRQIMVHLLNNSLKYTPSGGQVWVTAHSTADAVDLEVRDTGIGIAPGDLPHIFDHFYRGRNLPPAETEGAGLGLAIVRQLLLYCGGSVSARSQIDEGTTIVVRLPIYREPS